MEEILDGVPFEKNSKHLNDNRHLFTNFSLYQNIFVESVIWVAAAKTVLGSVL
jgi:hypothetical protein